MKEKLVCRLANPVAFHREGAYTEIISLARQFRATGAVPHPDAQLCILAQNSFTGQKHLPMQTYFILTDSLLLQEDPARLFLKHFLDLTD